MYTKIFYSLMTKEKNMISNVRQWREVSCGEGSMSEGQAAGSHQHILSGSSSGKQGEGSLPSIAGNVSLKTRTKEVW